MLPILWALALSSAPPPGQALQSQTASTALELAEFAEKRGDLAHAAYYYRIYMRQTVSPTDRLLMAERVGEILFAQSVSGRGLLELEAPEAVQAQIDGKGYANFPVVVFLEAGEHDLLLNFETKSYRRKFSITQGRVTSLEVDPRLIAEEPPKPLSSRNSAPVSGEGKGGSPNGWVVIAHRSLPGEISRERLRELFAGDRVVSQGGDIPQVVMPPAGSRIRASFLAEVLGKSEDAFRASWVKLVFRGGGVKPPIEARSEQEVIELVASHPGSFGVVGSGNDTSGVTRLFVR